jgi:DNA-binding XRE family transcriptional regulator
MAQKNMYQEAELAALAKKYRSQSGNSKEQAAKELEVGRPSIQLAEGTPEQSLTKLRIRIIERYSEYRVVGPVFFLEKK